MHANRLLPLCLMLTFSAANAQSYGLLLGGTMTDLRAAGVVFQPGKGLSLGAFVPFYVNDRLVLRAEAGVAAYALRGTGDESTTVNHRTEADITALCRYYVHRKVSLSLGIQGIRLLQAPEELVQGHTRSAQQRTDVCLLMGVAYRWTDRIETGLRYGQGLLPAAEMPLYGTAHRRYAHLMMSYLLHSSHTRFAERRKWRSGLSLAHRY